MKQTFNAAQKRARAEILRSARIANRNIRELTEEGYNSEAVKLLKERLSKTVMLTKKGTIRLRIPASVDSEMKIREIKQAFKFFERSETSTVSGMKNVIKRQREEIAKKTSTRFANKLTDQEILDYNEVYASKEWEAIKLVMGSGEANDIMLEAKQKRWSKKHFKDELSKYMDEEPDIELKESMDSIYNKYISSK